MVALTNLLGKPIRDPSGDEVARLQDLVVRVPPLEGVDTSPLEVYPAVIGLVARLRAPRGSRGAARSRDAHAQGQFPRRT
jgi:hypothetical protein